jgi:hypothetical protein
MLATRRARWSEPHLEATTMDLRHRGYDADLQMFIETSRDPDRARLTFLRWLVDRRRLEHGPAGAPAGDFAVWSVGSDLSADDREAA